MIGSELHDVRKKLKGTISSLKELVIISEDSESFGVPMPTAMELIKSIKTIIEKAK